MGVGTASDTTINGGRLTLDSGSTASVTKVGSNGRLTVFGGTTSDTTIDGNEEPAEEIYGGTVINTTIKNGEFQYVSNDCNNNRGAYGSAVVSNMLWKAAPNRSLDFLGLPPRSSEQTSPKASWCGAGMLFIVVCCFVPAIPEQPRRGTRQGFVDEVVNLA
ncbi:hypothetical protein HAP47_0020225 [Bradyrhizobium sp. 41S5]|uniref:hypothetical protein n=1 Tax=Bradyrhizobium sp. 41S5 TaxID=1404443 RepID=UPI00156B320E|nr:hypothetical protein [Bradyrhizobium sp. 41S5]UFX41647.1 hypothetical protein HAP47_0020225 [Bradyrhizobium sp. 41S5]